MLNFVIRNVIKLQYLVWKMTFAMIFVLNSMWDFGGKKCTVSIIKKIREYHNFSVHSFHQSIRYPIFL
jgi:hypothetical protein